MSADQVLEHLFRALITGFVGILIWKLKEFSTEFKNLQTQLNTAVSGLNSIIKDHSYSDQKAQELRKRVEEMELEISRIKERILTLEIKEKI